MLKFELCSKTEMYSAENTVHDGHTGLFGTAFNDLWAQTSTEQLFESNRTSEWQHLLWPAVAKQIKTNVNKKLSVSNNSIDINLKNKWEKKQ